jgi:hypothetical protein
MVGKSSSHQFNLTVAYSDTGVIGEGHLVLPNFHGASRAWLALSVLLAGAGSLDLFDAVRWQAEVAATTVEPWEMTWDTPPAQGAVVAGPQDADS